MEISKINDLEIKYFQRIKLLLETNGTTFKKNILSLYNLYDNFSDNNEDMSPIQRGLERVVQSIISEKSDWEVCTLPGGADSVFQTLNAVIHIDSKVYKSNDIDATGNKVNFGPNQTSIFSDTPIVVNNLSFSSKLPSIYNHNLFGEVPCLTFFIKLIYNMDNDLETFRDFQIVLCCLPNREVNTMYNNTYFQAGKTLSDRNQVSETSPRYRTSLRANFNRLGRIENQDVSYNWQRTEIIEMI